MDERSERDLTEAHRLMGKAIAAYFKGLVDSGLDAASALAITTAYVAASAARPSGPMPPRQDAL